MLCHNAPITGARVFAAKIGFLTIGSKDLSMILKLLACDGSQRQGTNGDHKARPFMNTRAVLQMVMNSFINEGYHYTIPCHTWLLTD